MTDCPEPIRLLLVEDSEDDAMLIAARLRRDGLAVSYDRVETAPDMAAALSAEPPDAVLCDGKLPAFDPQAALDLLHGTGIDLPFIVVSGQIGEECAAELMRAGAHDFVLKDNLTRLAPAVLRELREAAKRRHGLHVEAALRSSEERFRLVAEHLQDVVFRLRLLPHPVLEYVSPSIAAMAGVDPAEIYRDPERLLALAHPDDRAAMRESWQRPVSGPVVLRWKRPDGETIWVEQRALGIRGEHDHTVALEGILRDITEQVTADEARQELERRLHQSERLDSLGKLSGGVAHDFNNILGVIAGYSSLILGSMAQDDPNRPDVEAITKATEQGSALTRQLLIFSRRQPSRPETLDINEVIIGVRGLLDRTIGEDVEFDTRLHPDLLPVTMDRSRLEQVIVNIIVNARAAMPEGGTISIETAVVAGPNPGEATTGAEPPGVHPSGGAPEPAAFVRLSIRDTGYGMPPEVAQRAFEPFFTTKGPDVGTGLGLATVYGAVKEAAGTVSLWSEQGVGTRLDIYLPASSAPVSAGTAAAVADPGGSGEHVLVVEDNAEIREVAGRMLAAAGYHVTTSGDRAEAARLCAGSVPAPDLLLADVVMAGMSTREFIDNVRQVRPDLPIVLMSGYPGDESVAGRPLPHGIPLVNKPFDAATLLTRVREALGG